MMDRLRALGRELAGRVNKHLKMTPIGVQK